MELIEARRFPNAAAIIAQLRYMYREGWTINGDSMVSMSDEGDIIVAKPQVTESGVCFISLWRKSND